MRIQPPASKSPNLLKLYKLLSWYGLAVGIVLLTVVLLELCGVFSGPTGSSRDGFTRAIEGVLIGSAIAVAANVYSVWRSLRRKLTAAADQEPEGMSERIVADLFQGILGKFLLAGLMLGLVFRFIDFVDARAVLASFIVVAFAGSLINALVWQGAENGSDFN